ncbi:MAG: hypothetical protein ACPGJS_02100 [Flammeovirgaceae bacterium]
MKTDQLSFISNEAGIPNHDKTAMKVEKNINQWKKERKHRKVKKSASMPYWKQVSTCTVL